MCAVSRIAYCTFGHCWILLLSRNGERRGQERSSEKGGQGSREKELELDGENVCKSLCVCAFVRVGVLLFNYSF